MTAALRFMILTCVVGMLSACQTTSTTQLQDADKLDKILERVAREAQELGNPQDSLVALEQIYKRNSEDETAALRYAAALRVAGYAQKANLVLKPFALKEGASADVLTEYATLQAGLGYYDTAELYARRAVTADDQSHKAFQILGVALDAQGHHPQAETAFRKALDRWEGDPVPILNNLGLNLASQGFLDEAISTLRKAKALAPERAEVERNLRIVLALRESGKNIIRAPKPKAKPDQS